MSVSGVRSQFCMWLEVGVRQACVGRFDWVIGAHCSASRLLTLTSEFGSGLGSHLSFAVLGLSLVSCSVLSLSFPVLRVKNEGTFPASPVTVR